MDAMTVSQQELWNTTGANAWVDLRETLDDMFRGIETLLVEDVLPGQQVLDVGCGTGGTTLAVARRTGRATGVDISAPMIAVARDMAAAAGVPAEFLCADAQHYGFAPASFDALVSRFGMMFFEDAAAAFANLRHAVRSGGTLRFFAWRTAEENPFMTAAEHAVGALLPPAPPRRPDGPGQFAFADVVRVHGILAGAGWRDIRIAPRDVACAFPQRDLARYAAMMGPVGRALPQLDAAARAAIVPQAVAAFAPFVDGDTVRYTAACWDVAATAP
ncbi:class I SAM-dependent methyltransferase [Pseudoduganella umbonata]|uniref:Methyltransferase domain-containing protein n=1 Tax=Pseudoduganella umbonata TaxID=864828 RepID=A0A4P8HUQ7_9BURK|nr:class I SAM-dependent methyltransferase [Pseudoduganella umbonata]MBB3222936.1 SAM-dependent methyltransferase [Pseudoduganella umbonata]QCP13056.1 methyltransferase domain-containing protein [Pseudoduganella umbonata]